LSLRPVWLPSGRIPFREPPYPGRAGWRGQSPALDADFTLQVTTEIIKAGAPHQPSTPTPPASSFGLFPLPGHATSARYGLFGSPYLQGPYSAPWSDRGELLHDGLTVSPASKPHVYTHDFARNPLLRWSGT